MVRRGVGVAHVKNTKTTQQQMSELGAHMQAQKVSHIADQLKLVEERVSELSRKHEKQIRSDPTVRARFKQLADAVGIDMLTSHQNIFSKTLGLGDYYFHLSVRVIDICRHEKRFTGGLVGVDTVLSRLHRAHPEDKVSASDVAYSLEKVRALGSGYNIVTIGGKQFVQADLGGELSTDNIAVLALMSEGAGSSSSGSVHSASAEEIGAMLKWPPLRVDAALKKLLDDGSVWVDDESPVRFWFVLLMR